MRLKNVRIGMLVATPPISSKPLIDGEVDILAFDFGLVTRIDRALDEVEVLYPFVPNKSVVYSSLDLLGPVWVQVLDEGGW
jgi:hypothetical protein